MTVERVNRTGCCDPFDPAPFQDKTIEWQDKLFIKDRVKSLFHIPLNFGAVVVKNVKLIEKAEAKPEYQLMLVDEKSLWGADLYINVGKEVEGAKMERMTGKFFTRVYEGPFSKMGEWIKDFNDYCAKNNMKPKRLFFSYTTCPKCAKAYGKNYVVIFGKLQ
ncbi:MAG: hypothetical protein PHW02_06220 [bacterium]|nr:hypothetical protein [bacterium]